MNTYEQIMLNLKHGVSVIVEHEDGEFMTIHPIMNVGGYYLCSCWVETIEKAKTDFNGFCYKKESIREYLEKGNWQIVEQYQLPQGEPFKVRQKVRILDSINEIWDWKDYADSFPNMDGVIKENYNDIDGLYCNVWNKDKSIYLAINHKYLAPMKEIEPEPNCDEIIKAKEFLNEHGYKVEKLNTKAW